MKQITLIIAAAAFTASCNFHSTHGSGKIITQKRTAASFTAITVATSIDVEISTGPQAIEVEADDNIINYVETEVSGNELLVRYANNTSISNTHVKVHVTVPLLNKIEANSAASIKVLGVIKNSSSVSFSASSSADIEAQVDAPDVTAKASSSGSVMLSGRTKNYKVQVSSSGDVKSFDLMSENTDAKASSSGTAQVHASVMLNADANSSGDVEYKGGAAVTSNTSSSGSVNKKD
jgi:Putative auto-transporter adhesin, head GIN domain